MMGNWEATAVGPYVEARAIAHIEQEAMDQLEEFLLQYGGRRGLLAEIGSQREFAHVDKEAADRVKKLLEMLELYDSLKSENRLS